MAEAGLDPDEIIPYEPDETTDETTDKHFLYSTQDHQEKLI